MQPEKIDSRQEIFPERDPEKIKKEEEQLFRSAASLLRPQAERRFLSRGERSHGY